MQYATDADARRPVIIYIIIAAMLFAALLLGVRWAKNRSAYYAQQQIEQNQPVVQEGGQPTTPSAQEPPSQPQSTPASSTPATVLSVPATGAEDMILPIVSLSAVAFTAASYARARRKLRGLTQLS